MIISLRTTGIIAGGLAAVGFVFIALFGVRGDKEAEEFLCSAGAVELFGQAKSSAGQDSAGQTSPLVKAAEAFALFLNPPPRPEPVAAPSGPAAIPRPQTVSAKFDLIGTSFYALRPDMSLALIDEPGKGFRWLRQSDKVGHLVIERIEDGIVTVRDGQRTFELTAKRDEKRSLIKGESPVGAVAPPSVPGEALPFRRGGIRARPVPDMPQLSDEERAAMIDTLQKELEAMAMKIEANSPDANQPVPQGTAEGPPPSVTAEPCSVPPARLDANEAQKLGRLGRDLRTGRRPPRPRRQQRPGRITDPNVSPQ
jgi:hypothetical protein